MYAETIAWISFALLVLLCLPFAGIQKLVLEVYGVVLRLALLAALAAGAYLWFRPEELPAEVSDILADFPRLADILPAPGTQIFGIAAAALIVAIFLPVLAVLDVCRKLAGWRLRRLRVLSTGPGVTAPVMATPPAQRTIGTVRHRVDRRTAAETLAEVGSRKPFRVADQVEK